MAPRVEQVRLAEVATAPTRALPTGSAIALPVDTSLSAPLQMAGAKLDQASDNLAKIAIRTQTENNETAAKEADTQGNTVIRDTLFDPEKGYFTKQGKDAFESYKSTEEALRKAQADRAAVITNPEARKMYNDIATRRLDAALDTMAKHAALERRKWIDGVSITRAMNASDDAIAYADDPKKREQNLNVGRAEIITNGRDHGEDPEITNRKLREYDTKAYSGIVQRMMINDPIGAQKFYEENKHKIDGQQQIGLERTLKEATGRRTAESDADGVMNPTPQGERGNNIGNIVKSPFQYSGGKGKGDGAFETFTTPEHGVAAAVYTIDAKAKQNGGSITPLELIGGNDKVKGWAPADDGKTPLLKGNDPKSYATVIAKAAGIGINDPLPLNDPDKMADVLKAMNKHEHGKQTVPDAAYKGGLTLARGEQTHDGFPARKNADGTISTEVSITVTDKRLNDGKPTNIPSLWEGKEVSEDEAVKRALKSGKQYQSFATIDDAVKAAQERSAQKGADLSAPKAKTSTDPREVAREIEANFSDYVARARELYKDDPERMDKALAVIAKRKAIAEEGFAAQLKVDTEKAWNIAVTADATGARPTSQDAIPPALWTKLSPQTQEALTRQFAHNLKGTQQTTDQNVWYEVQRGLSSEDPKTRQEWAKKNLLEYRGKLSPSDFQELAKMQGAISKGDPDGHLTAARTVNGMVDDTLRTLGIDPTPKQSTSETSDAAKAAKFRRAVQDQLTGLETAQGKKATPEQTQQIIDAMTKQVVTGKGWFGDSTKRRFEVTVEDVPKEEKAKIIDALTRAGRPISDAIIVDLFSRKNAKATTK